MMFKIREVIDTPDDIDDLCALARAFHAESGRKSSFVPNVLANSVHRICADTDRQYMNVWMIYDAGEPIGFALGQCSPIMHSTAIAATLTYIFVRKDYRGSRAALKLIRVFENWGRERGAVEFYAGITTHVNTERNTRLLSHMGYAPVGAMQMKEITDAAGISR